MKSRPKVIWFIETIYFIVKVSCLFWGLLLKKGVIYGWGKTIGQLMEYLQGPDPYHDSFRKTKRKEKQSVPYDLFLSGLTTFAFSLFILSWLTVLQKPSAFSIFLVAVGSFLWICCLLFYPLYLSSSEKNGAQRVYQTLRQLIFERFNYTLSGFILLFLFIVITVTKNLLGLVIFPGLYLFLYQIYLQKLTNKETEDDLCK